MTTSYLEQARQSMSRIEQQLPKLGDVALGRLITILESAEHFADSLASLESNHQGQATADGQIASSAEDLLLAAAALYVHLETPAALQVARQHIEIVEAQVEKAFVAILNVMDFQDPSWAPVTAAHLNFGFEVIAARRYILRGYARFGPSSLPDMNLFPQLP
ncbi:hypothetical protein [Deinococcus soli (ex Cha et al. 2016)]|uniref:hypothetical protein n=1 Tax=Deinococcus soli (ex Cha et al. 2016) TaxID=1309411 RepID=UPI00166CD7FF|nr:hypothetical protein [Deinococcus soli (ex Cha et al. 2016)]GGB70666.1 hypothetical protein GCM10008019_28540 [Deinococcus soli (ex Cha et al. 2016)]